MERWRDFNQEEFDSGYPDYDRVRRLLVESSKTIQWLADIGAKFIPNLTIEKNFFDTVKVDVATTESTMGGAKLVQEMQNKAEENGAKFLTNMTATSLKIENDKVTGLIAESKDGTYEISAKNVILACGGFGGNNEMMAKYVKSLDKTDYYYQGLESNTGDGITMAEAAGADIYSEGWVAGSNITPSKKLIDTNKQFAKLIQGFVYTVRPEGDPIEGASSYYHLLVDKEGNRVGNEAEGARDQIRTLADLGSAPYYVLYDNPKGELKEILESGLGMDEVFKGEDLIELAEDARMDIYTLGETVEKYNEAAIEGIDSEYGKEGDYLNEIGNEGPYYLVHFVPSYVATYGGVKTNENYQAIREDGLPIENLYAVGENAIRFAYNRNYVAGASNNFSLSMGRIAAIHALSKNSPKE